MLLIWTVLALAACGGRVAALAPTVTAAPASVVATSRPSRVELPADESPHGDLTEWWYYTGHLATAEGHRYGFELVFFQSRRGDTPPGYEAHFAVTDLSRRTFQYAARTASGEQGGMGSGFDLAIGSWRMHGFQGHDAIQGQLGDYALNLQMRATTPAVLHRGSGLIDFGAFGASYYYSRPRMAVQGSLVDHGHAVEVTGTAWMDHQWGNFIVGSVGGWNWFAIQLKDGTDIMLSFNRGADNRPYLSYGTYVAPSGRADDLPSASFSERPTGSWTSPHSGVTYPSGWVVQIPAYHLDLTIQPSLKDQELAFGGKPGEGLLDYWEGAVTIDGHRDSQTVTGEGYVELTGYVPHS